WQTPEPAIRTWISSGRGSSRDTASIENWPPFSWTTAALISMTGSCVGKGAVDPSGVQLAQLSAKDLSAAGLGQVRDQLESTGNLVGRQPAAAMRFELFDIERGSLLRHDVRLGELALDLVRNAADRHHRHTGVLGDDPLQFSGIDVESSRDDH